MNSLFLQYQAKIIKRLELSKITLVDSKEINYAVQLNFNGKDLELKLTLYYNAKNNFKYVINKIKPYEKKDEIIGIIEDNQLFEPVKQEKNWAVWAGSDESGKGDYFGPLVVVAFACRLEDVKPLTALGVKDSKLIKDDNIIQIAKKVFVDFKGNYNYFVLMPHQYNELYDKFTQTGQKLNEMLAWMHSQVLFDLYQKIPFEGAVIDKFANEKVITNYIRKKSEFDLNIKPYAESDIAVATASVLARFLFLQKMDELSDKYNVKLLRGASQRVKDLKNQIYSQDKDLLNYIAKLHFNV